MIQITILKILLNIILSVIRPVIIVGGLLVGLQLTGTVDFVGIASELLVDSVNPFVAKTMETTWIDTKPNLAPLTVMYG